MRVRRAPLARPSRLAVLWLLPVAAALGTAGVACGAGAVDLQQSLKVTDVTTGWFDAGIVRGKNKLVPSVSFRLKNTASIRISGIQINAVFRRVGEQDELGSSYTSGISVDPNGSTPVIVLRSQIGYTGEQPRAEMLRHKDFRDTQATVFAKRGAAQWVKLGEFPIQRQLITHEKPGAED